MNLLFKTKIAIMKKKLFLRLTVIFAITFFLSSCKKNGRLFCNCNEEDLVASVSVFSTGLDNPRGLKFGPDGYLYVAEGGIGGKDFSGDRCTQVIPPVGPYTGSITGSRISRITSSGSRTTFVDNLPSSQTSAALGNLVSGVADIAFIGNTMYALLAGAGCSHGVPSIPNGIIKVNPDRSWKMIADLSAWQMTHPTKVIQPADFEPDGTWYGMTDAGGDLYAVEPNHGELVKITPKGDIYRVADISASQGHIVPDAVAFHDGNFFVGNLNTFPIADGSASIYKITPGGQVSVYATGFSTIVGVTFDKLGAMYVLENTVGAPGPTPGLGQIVRIDKNGTRLIVISGLNLPTALTFGPDDKLYVSNWGFGMPAGGGQILQISITCDNNHSVKQ